MLSKRPELDREPQNVNENVWYYEGLSGLRFIVWIVNEEGKRVKALMVKVPTRTLLKTMKRIRAVQKFNRAKRSRSHSGRER